MSDIKVGDKITWLHVIRGGYGYVERITGTVVKVTSKRVRIAVKTKDGETVRRWIRRENITRGDS